MKKEIQRWYRELERTVGRDKAEETETLVEGILASFMEDHVEALGRLQNIVEQLSNAIKEGKEGTQDNIKKLRSGG